MSITLSIDGREVDRNVAIMITAILSQTTRAVAAQTRGLEKDLEALTRAAAGGNLWRAWKSEVYPGGGKPSYHPAGEVFVNGGTRSKGAMTYWTQPGQNQKKGGWLAIPTKNAGVLGRSRNLTPREWERAHGTKLHFVRRDERHALLMARHVYQGNNGKGVRVATKRRQKNKVYAGKQIKDVTIFVLIPVQMFGNKFSIDAAIERRGKMLIADFERRMARFNKAGSRFFGE